MAIVVAILFVAGLFIFRDRVRYWRRIDDFERRAMEFSKMYKKMLPKALGEGEKDVEEFSFEGACYRMCIKNGDKAAFYSQLEFAIADVLDSYDRIGERYISLMDDITAKEISTLYDAILKINHIIRYNNWIQNRIRSNKRDYG
jgi:hypothetical protein